MIYRALLIDDEPLALQRMRRLLAAHADQISLVGEATDGQAGRELVEQLRPDLVFLDIEMPGLNGFEVLQGLAHLPLVIFVTAYDAYAIRAFEENSVDYLLKPVEPERLAASVQKLQRLLAQPEQALALAQQQLQQALVQWQPKAAPASLPVRVGDRVIFVRLAEVAYCQAEDKYAYLHTLDGRKHLVEGSLTALEAKLPAHFLRVSRAEIINKDLVKEVSRLFSGKFLVKLQDKAQTEVTTGSSYAEAVRAWLGW
jgi:two-component system LytT family response regulator